MAVSACRSQGLHAPECTDDADCRIRCQLSGVAWLSAGGRVVVWTSFEKTITPNVILKSLPNGESLSHDHPES